MVFYGMIREMPWASAVFSPDRNRGRIAVSRSVRGRGAGSLLVKGTEAAVKELGGTEIRLHAQVRAQHFYKALGYEAYGPVEPEEGVPHQWMKKQVG